MGLHHVPGVHGSCAVWNEQFRSSFRCDVIVSQERWNGVQTMLGNVGRYGIPSASPTPPRPVDSPRL